MKMEYISVELAVRKVTSAAYPSAGVEGRDYLIIPAVSVLDRQASPRFTTYIFIADFQNCIASILG